MEAPTNAAAIKAFFQSNGGRKVTMEEFKQLSKGEREELGQLAAEALSITSTNDEGAAESDEDPDRKAAGPVSQDATHVE